MRPNKEKLLSLALLILSDCGKTQAPSDLINSNPPVQLGIITPDGARNLR